MPTMRPIEIGSAATGTVPRGGARWLSFQVERKGKYQVSTPRRQGIVLWLGLFGPDNRAIPITVRFKFSCTKSLQPGKYFVKIESRLPNASSAYSITVSKGEG